MKFIKVLAALLLMAGPVMAEKSHDTVVMGDFDSTAQGFSFSRGELISVDREAESLSMEIDFIFDIPNGLGMNNGELGSWFSGRAMIADLGDIPLDKKANPAEDEFTPFLIPDEMIPGHTYLIRTADSKHYGKIRIEEFDYDNSRLVFSWVSMK